MTLYQKSSWFAAAVLALLFILMAFNYGRLTASQVTLRSTCDLEAADREDLKAAWYIKVGGRQ